jgi:dihydrolipoamide dehydrogenase
LIAAVGLTEAEARQQYGDAVVTGKFSWLANACAVIQNEAASWVKSIHETRQGELLGLVMVGPHVTDMIEAGVVAIDAINGAAHAALGRAIDVPNRKRARSTA